MRRIGGVLAIAAISACTTRSRSSDDPTLKGVVDVAIGPLDQDAPSGPKDLTVAGLAMGPDGRLVVADEHARTVRVFTASGRSEYSIPFPSVAANSEPCCVAFGPDHRLWAFDRGDTTYRGYRLTRTGAALERSIRAPDPVSGTETRVLWDSAGRLVHLSDKFDSTNGEFHVARAVIDTTGAVLWTDTLPSDSLDSTTSVDLRSANGRGLTVVAQPFGPRELRAFGLHGDRAEAIASRYDITWLDAANRIVQQVHGEAAGPDVSWAERRQAEAQLERLAANLRVPRKAIPFGVPKHKSPVRALGFDLDGRLWVEHTVREHEAHLADVYDRSGKLVARVEWPREVQLSYWAIRGDSALGSVRTRSGLERVVRLHFVPN